MAMDHMILIPYANLGPSSRVYSIYCMLIGKFYVLKTVTF